MNELQFVELSVHINEGVSIDMESAVIYVYMHLLRIDDCLVKQLTNKMQWIGPIS